MKVKVKVMCTFVSLDYLPCDLVPLECSVCPCWVPDIVSDPSEGEDK